MAKRIWRVCSRFSDSLSYYDSLSLIAADRCTLLTRSMTSSSSSSSMTSSSSSSSSSSRSSKVHSSSSDDDEEDWQECEQDSSVSQTSSSSSDDRAGSNGGKPDWKTEARRGGSLKQVDLNTGGGGWASPPGECFQVRGPNYFSKKTKVRAGEWLFKPLGVDWLKSGSKMDNLLGKSDNRIMKLMKKAGVEEDAFVFAVNLQVPGKEHHSAVFYYVVEEKIVPGTLLHRFIHEEDDAFRNNRFKLINRVVKGPWIVRAAVGNHAACLLGKALTCKYLRGRNYLEIDVDIGSSTVANYILHLALGYVNSVSVDMAFLVEAQSEEELPERLMGAVRIAQIDMESAVFVEGEGTVAGVGDSAQEKNGAPTGGAPGLQSSLSWKKLSRSFSLLGHGCKAGKVDDEHTRSEQRVD